MSSTLRHISLKGEISESLQSEVLDIAKSAELSFSNTLHLQFETGFDEFGVTLLYIPKAQDMHLPSSVYVDDSHTVILLITDPEAINEASSIIQFYIDGTIDCSNSENLKSKLPELLKLALRRNYYTYLGGRGCFDSQRALDELVHDQEAAYRVQRQLLPPKRTVFKGVQYEYILKPSLIASGDFVDFFEVDEERQLFYLADVSGHGASSALVTILLKNITRRLLRNLKRGSSFDILSPQKTLERINKEIVDLGLGKHLTMLIGLFDQNKKILRYSIAGHHPAPVYLSDLQTKLLTGQGMAVGIFPDAEYEESELAVDERFELYLFSDGVLDHMKGSTISTKEQELVKQLQSGNMDLSILSMQLEGITSSDDIAAMKISKVRND